MKVQLLPTPLYFETLKWIRRHKGIPNIMLSKSCSKCGLTKSLGEFAKRNEKLASECKECHKLYAHNHYLNNHDYYLAKAENRRHSLRKWFTNLKRGLKCKNCGEADWRCLDFNHLDPKTKEMGVANLVNRKAGKQHILEEIAKCVVLCANCHRKVTIQDNR